MALSIQAGTGSDGLCCWVSGCERRAAEEEEVGKDGLGMDARLGAESVLEEVEIFDARVLSVAEFPCCDIIDGVDCWEVVTAGGAVSFSASMSSL